MTPGEPQVADTPAVEPSVDEVYRRQIAELLDSFGESFIALGFDWRVLHVNRAAENHFRFQREAVLGRVLWDLIPGRDGPIFSLLAPVMEGREPANLEVPSDINPGQWLAMRAFPLETGIGVSFRDITERRERLRREREQAERLELALAASGLGDWSWDLATDRIDYSQHAGEIWGLPPGSAVTWADLQPTVYPDDLERVRSGIAKAVTEQTIHETEYRIVRPVDGEVRWIMIRGRAQYADDGRPVSMLGVVADVTNAKAEEAKVRADRERLAQLESRNAFLLHLSDTLREIEDADQIMATASRLLGERLDVGRAGYAEISEDGQSLTVGRDWVQPGFSSLSGLTFPLDAFGPELVEAMRLGQVQSIDDVLADPRSAPFADAYAAIDIRAIVTVPVIRVGRLDAFFALTAREPRAWSGEDVGLAVDVAARTWSSLARARVSRALRESEARFRAMADSAPAPVWVTSAAGPIEFVNRAFCEFAGKGFEDLLGDAWISIVHPEDVQRVGAIRAAARAGPDPYVFEARFRGADGAWRLMQASSQPRFDAEGVFQGYVGLAIDVTEQRRAEERQRLLINELNHRVKNTLATVQSLAHQTLRDGVPREARSRFTDRLLALSAAHNVLTRENWEGAELSAIAREAVRPYDDPAAPRIAIEGPAVRLAPNVALAVSMALHELATNAVKYGALASPDGRVGLAWTHAGGFIHLEWREMDGPPVHEPEGRGFGSRLLAGLATELGAPAEVRFERSGLVCRLTAPAA